MSRILEISARGTREAKDARKKKKKRIFLLRISHRELRGLRDFLRVWNHR